MNIHALHFKLTGWYFAILALGLCVAGVAAWFGMRASLYDALDDGLLDRIQGVRKFMEEQISALSVAEIRDEFREHSVLGPGGDLFQVCDQDGGFLYRSTLLDNNQVPIRKPGELGSEPLYETAHIQNTPVRMASQRIEVNHRLYTVEVAAAIDDIDESLERFRSLLSICLPLVLAVATAGGYWLSRRALAPVDQITAAARSISIQNLTERLAVPHSGDELQRLSETLNEMLSRLENSVRRITQFTADASHELRAPLALIRTTAELALRRDRPPAEYREALAQVLTESEETTKLVDSLLLLARADSGTENLQLRPVNAADIIRDAVAQGQKLGAGKRIRVEAALSRGRVEVAGDPQALRRLLLILLDNAVKYTPPDGAVEVRLSAADGVVTITVKDSGIGIAERDLPHVFDRFWRADKARAREGGGVGLGLSIARLIIERHHGSISVESQPGQGSTFRVQLPLYTRP